MASKAALEALAMARDIAACPDDRTCDIMKVDFASRYELLRLAREDTPVEPWRPWHRYIASALLDGLSVDEVTRAEVRAAGRAKRAREGR